MEDALTLKGDEGRGVPAISVGEAASSLRSGDDRMGQPHRVNLDDSAQAGSKPGEVKHFSTQRKRNRIDPLSSGERKGSSLNRLIRKN